MRFCCCSGKLGGGTASKKGVLARVRVCVTVSAPTMLQEYIQKIKRLSRINFMLRARALTFAQKLASSTRIERGAFKSVGHFNDHIRDRWLVRHKELVLVRDILWKRIHPDQVVHILSNAVLVYNQCETGKGAD